MTSGATICIANSREWVVTPKTDSQGKELPELQARLLKSLHLPESQDSLALDLRDNLRDLIIYVVVSTLSGTEQASSFFDQILSPLLLGWDLLVNVRIEYTHNAQTIMELGSKVFSKDANAGIPQLIILLSGDGGVVDILNSITVESADYVAPQIALIPMGTGNALAHSARLTADNTWGLATLARGQAQPLPTFKARFSPSARLLVNEGRDVQELPGKCKNGEPCIHGAVVCSWGFHASLVADSDTAEYRKFGGDRFSMAGRQALYPADGSGPHIYKARISLKRPGVTGWTQMERTEHMYVLMTMVSNLEKTFTISPASQPLDGSMRIVEFGVMSSDEIIGLMDKAYQGGGHIGDDRVSYEQIEGLRIDFDGIEHDARWRRICVDGKIITLDSHGWVEITKDDTSLLTLRHLA